MKILRILTPLLLVAMLSLCFSSCELRKKEIFEYSGDGFVSRVVKVEGGSLLVEPANDDAPEARSSNKFSVPNYFDSRVRKGDIVIIEHDGSILETSPAAFGKIFSMTLVGDNGINESVQID